MSANFAEAHNIIGTGGSAVFVSDGGARVNQRTEFDQAVLDGRAFSWPSQTYDPDANDTIIGVENNSATHVLKIQKIVFTSDTASLIQVFTINAVTMAGTAIVGANFNRASGRVADATAKTDETGNSEQAGGYTNKLLQKQVAANTLIELVVDGAIVLPQDWMVGVDLTSAATAANATIFGWFEPI